MKAEASLARASKTTTRPQLFIVILVLLFGSSASAGEVIFSRRVYKERGASYQQIWTWNPADGALKELTHSPRDHYHPTCDGRIVKFTSPSPDVTNDVRLWTMNPATGEENAAGPAPEPKGRPDSRTQSCDHSAKLGDLEACGNEETLVVSRSGRRVGQFQIQVNTCQVDNDSTIGKCETPIRSLDWTEDGKWLLIGEEGLNDASGQRQNDYYLVNPVTMKLSPVASAYTAFWLPGAIKSYTSPRNTLSRFSADKGNTVFGCSSLCSSIPSKECPPPLPLALAGTWTFPGAKAPGNAAAY